MDQNAEQPEKTEQEQDVFPIEPNYHPLHKIPRKLYDFLASARLAMGLLVVILICCLAGVTVWRGAEAGRVIFGALWFNSILVLLVINIACCFFGRIWGRRVTVVSFGMILFHLSFVAILLGVIYNSLFYFRGYIRLTEGEVLPSSEQQSYDLIDHGVLFNFAKLRGETSLTRVHTGYTLEGEDKRVAYEVTVGEGASKTTGLIYITHKLVHRGFEYFTDREGYSLLLALLDKQGKMLYGGHFPLQSIRQKDGSFVYVSGYRDGDIIRPFAGPFPAPPESPLMALQVEYILSKQKERDGEVRFIAYPSKEDGTILNDKALADGRVPIGRPFAVGNHSLLAAEVRYWVMMSVRYEPGKPLVLASLWTGLAGVVITTLGRIMRKRR